MNIVSDLSLTMLKYKLEMAYFVCRYMKDVNLKKIPVNAWNSFTQLKIL